MASAGPPVPGEEMAPRGKAVEAATSGRPELAQAWALIAIFDELKAMRLEQHRQARAGARRG
jgi:hypothetical protein